MRNQWVLVCELGVDCDIKLSHRNSDILFTFHLGFDETDGILFDLEGFTAPKIWINFIADPVIFTCSFAQEIEVSHEEFNVNGTPPKAKVESRGTFDSGFEITFYESDWSTPEDVNQIFIGHTINVSIQFR